jgi:amino acid transporter
MQVALIIFSVILLAAIIYFAVSPKSSRLLKISALIALGLIALSIGVCGIILMRGPVASRTAVPLPFITDDSPPVRRTNTPAILSFVAVFLFLLGVTAYLTGKERTTLMAPEKRPAAAPVYKKESVSPQKNDITEEEHIGLDDESFDIGID